MRPSHAVTRLSMSNVEEFDCNMLEGILHKARSMINEGDLEELLKLHQSRASNVNDHVRTLSANLKLAREALLFNMKYRQWKQSPEVYKNGKNVLREKFSIQQDQPNGEMLLRYASRIASLEGYEPGLGFILFVADPSLSGLRVSNKEALVTMVRKDEIIMETLRRPEMRELTLFHNPMLSTPSNIQDDQSLSTPLIMPSDANHVATCGTLPDTSAFYSRPGGGTDLALEAMNPVLEYQQRMPLQRTARKSEISIRKRKRKRRRVTKPHICWECQREFAAQATLVAHMRQHTGERPFACMECPKTYTDQKSLNAHERKHTEPDRFTCKKCSTPLASKRGLNDHMGRCAGKVPIPWDNFAQN